MDGRLSGNLWQGTNTAANITGGAWQNKLSSPVKVVLTNILATVDSVTEQAESFLGAVVWDTVGSGQGDMSEIGEQGINRSGGQKARLSLPRLCTATAILCCITAAFLLLTFTSPSTRTIPCAGWLRPRLIRVATEIVTPLPRRPHYYFAAVALEVALALAHLRLTFFDACVACCWVNF